MNTKISTKTQLLIYTIPQFVTLHELFETLHARHQINSAFNIAPRGGQNFSHKVPSIEYGVTRGRTINTARTKEFF